MQSTCRTSLRRAREEAEERSAALAAVIHDIETHEPEPERDWRTMTDEEADAMLDECDAQFQRAHDAGLFPYLMDLWDRLPDDRRAKVLELFH